MRRLGIGLTLALTVVAAGTATAVAGLVPGPPSAAAATRAAPSSPAVTHSSHISYLSCHAPDVLLTGSIRRQPFAEGQLVTYKVSLHNLSQHACGYPNGVTVPTSPVIPAPGLLGPCGELPVQIENSHDAVVYPAIGVGCPLILGPPLAAGQTITTTGTWDQTAWDRAAALHGAIGPLVPRGGYHIVIDGKVTLPVDLTGPPFVSPPATLPPPSSAPSTSPTPFQPLPNLPVPTVPSHLPAPPVTPTAPTSPTSPTPTTPTPTPSGHAVTRSAHVAFEGCAAKNVTLTVAIPAGPTVSAPVRYDVTLHNGGNTACGEAFRNNPPATRHFRVGPCSAMPATFLNAFGVDVYPGPQTFMCPMIAGPYVAPHATVTTTATWPGEEYLATSGGPTELHPASPGPYVLVVDNAVKVPFTLTASP